MQHSQLSSFLYGIRSQSANGVLGDPTGAQAEIGEELLQMAAKSLLRDVTAPPVAATERQEVGQAT